MKILHFFVFGLLLSFGAVQAQTPSLTAPLVEKSRQQTAEPKIQIALLLDASGSMDGLIEQAKAQLWKIVNELARSRKDGKAPNIELALYEYGKDNHPSKKGYLLQLAPLTTDLDLVSEKLFEIRTNGGSEYCGWAIEDALDNLNWSDREEDLKLIFIAGNERFTQGPKNYKEVCKAAVKRNIVVNTIFCGACKQGVQLAWKDGADRAEGKYLCINQNEKIAHIEAPQDAEILRLNEELNQTYMSYGGRKGAEMKARQKKQDVNAAAFSLTERAISKSSGAYKNSSWDAVDAYVENEDVILEADEEELPEELQGLGKEKRKEVIETKMKERERIQDEIQELSKQRSTYISAERKKQAGKKGNSLDDAMLDAVREQATKEGFIFEK